MPNDALLRLLQMGQRPTKAVGFDPNYLGNESIDPSVRADAGLGAMQGEVRDRLFNAERTLGGPDGYRSPNATSPFEVRALSNLLGGIASERAASPLVKQQAETDQQRINDVGAINEGFTGSTEIGRLNKPLGGGYVAPATMSPMQQREIYKRNQTQQNSPATLQAKRIEDEQFRQGRQLNQANRTVQAQMAPAMMDAESRKQYNDALLSGKLDNMGGYRGMNRYGPQFTPAPQVNPNTVNQNVQREFGYVPPGTDPFEGFGQPNSPNPALEQSIRTALANYGFQSPESQQEILEIFSNSTDRRLPFDDLVKKYNIDPNDPDTLKARQFFLQFRGF